MYPQHVHEYLRSFFTETGCTIVQETPQALTVQLTIDMDKRIMNRPYYWSYIESIQDEPKPMKLTLITRADNLANPMPGEIIHYGSPRLSQLFQVTRERGSFVRMFEKTDAADDKQAVLTPWLGVNYKITYSSDRTKEMLHSLGMNLMTGAVINGFQEKAGKLQLEAQIPPHTFYLPYTIPPMRALDRLDALIDRLINDDDHTWAEEAKARKKRDLKVLDYFYEGVIDKPECYDVEKRAIEEQYEAVITVDIINGGLFYLK